MKTWPGMGRGASVTTLCTSPATKAQGTSWKEEQTDVSLEDMWRLVKYCLLDMAQSLLRELPAAVVVACIRPLQGEASQN